MGVEIVNYRDLCKKCIVVVHSGIGRIAWHWLIGAVTASNR